MAQQPRAFNEIKMLRRPGDQEYLERKLSFYGYPAAQVRELLHYQPSLSLEQAVHQLSQDEQGRWNHSFKDSAGLCRICGDDQSRHAVRWVGGPRQRLLLPESTECQICYLEVAMPEGRVILSCGHMFCDECLSEYLAYQISVGQVSLCCPDRECSQRGAQIYRQLLQRHLLTPESYQKYVKFTRRQ